MLRRKGYLNGVHLLKLGKEGYLEDHYFSGSLIYLKKKVGLLFFLTVDSNKAKSSGYGYKTKSTYVASSTSWYSI